MRLDKYLKVSRLIKRRSVAKELASRDIFFLNGKPCKPSSEIKEGDEVKRTNRIMEVPVGDAFVGRIISIVVAILGLGILISCILPFTRNKEISSDTKKTNEPKSEKTKKDKNKKKEDK